MIVSDASLVRVAKKVRVIREWLNRYCLGNSHQPPVSIEDLHRCVEDMYDIKIVKRAVTTRKGSASSVRGSMARRKPDAIVLVDNSLSDFMKRFTAAKELCQIAIDKEDDWSMNAEETINDLLVTYRVDRQSNGKLPLENNIVLSEILAEIAALEVLYPMEYRAADRQRVVLEGQTVLTSLEVFYQIPRSLIDRVLDDSYEEVSSLITPYLTGEAL